MLISMAEAKEAERVAKAERIAAGRWLRVDEGKASSPRDTMLLHRVRAVAAERTEAFDVMIRDMDFNRLFNEGAIYIERAVR